jgi:hypothetical protein
MRAKPTRLGLIALSLVLASSAGGAYVAPSVDATISAATHLRAALQAFNRKDMATAETAVSAALDDPSFDALDEPTRHITLALGAQIMLQAGKPVKAERFALQATQMPEQDLDDWRYRLSAASKLHNPREEAECVTAIFRQWGGDFSVLTEDTVFSVFRDTEQPEFSDVRMQMLKALYERRWHPRNGRTASHMWLELGRVLLEADEADRAAQVAVLIDAPDDIITMHADNRYRPLLKLKFVNSNAKHAASNHISTLEDETRQQARSLRTLQYLLAAMAQSRMDAEVLNLTADVDRRIQAAGAADAAYDEYTLSYNWILNARAQALRHLARYDEAIDELRRATQLPDRHDKVSQSINLASLLCALDRPEEALASLPSDDVSAYGRMQIELIRFTAALERRRDEDAEQALGYLREHRADSAATLELALLRSGALDEAEQLLLWRLSDPVQRASALLETQRYFEPPRPPRATEWHARRVALQERATVLAAVKKVGAIDSYTWRYDTDD